MNPKECIKSLKRIIELDKKSNMHLTAMLWGGAGVGKSTVVKTAGEELGYIVRDIRLSTLSPVDVRGIPFVDQNSISYDAIESINKLLNGLHEKSMKSSDVITIQNNKAFQTHLLELKHKIENSNIEQRFKFIPPEFMPTGKEDKPVLLFFDEINTSVPANQVVAYEIALDRKMGGHPLPENTAVVMAGNRIKDRGATYEMPMPLANRLIHIEINSEIDQYLEYGLSKKFEEGVLAFLKTKPTMLEVAPSSGNWAFPTPRTWEMVSTLLIDDNENNVSEIESRQLISSTIGIGAASELFNFLKLRHELPNLDSILETGTQWTHAQKDILYFYIITLSSRLLKYIVDDNEDYTDKIDNFINAIEPLDAEMKALSINCIINNKKVMLYMGKNRALMNSIRNVLK